jgi:hypothetical protein
MAQELPNNPNTGGQGNQSSNYTEVRAPQFVGGNTNPTTGNIDPSSKSQAAVAPPPQQPTTQLANVDVPKAPSTAAEFGGLAASTALPWAGAQVGSQVGAGTSIGTALSTTASKLGGAVGLGGSNASTAGSTLGIEGGAETGQVLGESVAGGAGKAASEGIGGLTELAGTSALGGAAGAGIGAGISTAVTGALSGEQPKQYIVPALEATAGAAIGFAIGNVVLPGIGGFIGSAIGSMFCHAAGTMIRMEDGTLKDVEQLKIGDRVLLGGAVIGCGKVLAEDMFIYKGTLVNARHAVFEDGRWMRVIDSADAIYADVKAPVLVYPVVTENHLLVCEGYICADLAELDQDIGSVGRLAALNDNHERNTWLAAFEREQHSRARPAA